MIALNQRYSYQDILQSMQMISEKFPEFTICRMIGQTHDDRHIPMMRVGLGMETLVCTAGLHGKESVNPVLLLRMMEEYCTAYRENEKIGDTDVHHMLNQYSICFIPLVNPDGYEIAMHGYEIIQNPLLRRICRRRNINFQDWKYNARGVDINRNFPSKTYIQQQLQEYPASEQETQALIHIFQDYDTIGYLDFHSRGNIIYYYRQTMPYTYNMRCRHLAKHLQRASGYLLGKKEEEFMSSLNGGNSVHFYSESIGKPAITIETVEDDASYPLSTAYQSDAYQRIHALPLILLQQLKS